MKVAKINIREIRQAYELSGPRGREILMLVHGFPDSPRSWDEVLPYLHEAGFRTVTPYLRGYGPSTFRDPLLGRKRRRTGQPVAFAHDLIKLADHLRMRRFHFIGHDWGARTGYVLATLFAQRLKSNMAISVPFHPGKAKPPQLPQARAFWYQWLLCTKPGEEKFREDPVAFGKAQWDSWSPGGWYAEEEFWRASESWQGNDFCDVVLHSYRCRWGHAPIDPRYASAQQRYEAAEAIAVPTLLIHGEDDRCELLATTEGADQHFSGLYRRAIIKEVGHFPQREAAQTTAELILQHIREVS